MANINTIALIVAAGTGERMGADLPKQYMPLLGETVLRRTIKICLYHSGISKVAVVIHPVHELHYQQAVAGLEGLLPPIMGGATRQESVRLGLTALRALNPDRVLIHDAARALVPPDLITDIVASDHEAAIPALAVTDTLRRKENNLTSTIDRKNIYLVQTPQAFDYKTITALHEKYKADSFTDDAALYETEGRAVSFVAGSPDNIKITHAEDLRAAEKILLSRLNDARTGTGFDVHRLVPAPQAGKKLMLCGVDVPHDFALEGHSDADVGLHAITDAILGAISEGDIGHHFSPNDARWKDADSAFFLRYAANMVSKKGGIIAHVDVTLICEGPKIGPHRDAMRLRLANILEISMDRISVKATTTEGLGFTGRGEGIAAQSSVTVRLP